MKMITIRKSFGTVRQNLIKLFLGKKIFYNLVNLHQTDENVRHLADDLNKNMTQTNRLFSQIENKLLDNVNEKHIQLESELSENAQKLKAIIESLSEMVKGHNENVSVKFVQMEDQVSEKSRLLNESAMSLTEIVNRDNENINLRFGQLEERLNEKMNTSMEFLKRFVEDNDKNLNRRLDTGTEQINKIIQKTDDFAQKTAEAMSLLKDAVNSANENINTKFEQRNEFINDKTDQLNRSVESLKKFVEDNDKNLNLRLNTGAEQINEIIQKTDNFAQKTDKVMSTLKDAVNSANENINTKFEQRNEFINDKTDQLNRSVESLKKFVEDNDKNLNRRLDTGTEQINEIIQKTDNFAQKTDKAMSTLKDAVNGASENSSMKFVQMEEQFRERSKQLNESAWLLAETVNRNYEHVNQQFEQVEKHVTEQIDEIIQKTDNFAQKTDKAMSVLKDAVNGADENSSMKFGQIDEHLSKKTDHLKESVELLKKIAESNQKSLTDSIIHKTDDLTKKLDEQSKETIIQITEVKDVLQKGIQQVDNRIPNKPILWSNDFERGVVSANWGDVKEQVDYKMKFLKLISGLDRESTASIVRILSRQNKYLNSNQKCLDIYTREEQEELRKLKDHFDKEIYKISDDLYIYQNYLLPVRHFEASVFYYKHGLNQVKTLDRVRGKDIVDVGGYIGDSVLILNELFPKRIFTFEALPDNYKLLQKTLELNQIKDTVAENIGLGERSKTMVIHMGDGSASTSTMIDRPGIKYSDDIEVPVIALDEYVEKNNLDIGLIKVDIEGGEPAFLEGAKNTICCQKPILLLSIYHNAHDFFELKPLIESWDLGYKFSIHKPIISNLTSETLLIAEID